MKRKVTAAVLTACMILTSLYVLPANMVSAEEISAETVAEQIVESESETETETETETTAQTETEIVLQAEEETESETEAETETVAQTETEIEVAAQEETAAQVEAKAAVQEETAAQTETEAETEPETEAEQDPGYLYDQLRQAADEEDEGVLLQAGSGVASSVKAVGVDVWNGNGKIDWAKAKAAGVQFAIIRVGFRYLSQSAMEVDARAVENMSGAKAAGSPFGVYFFPTAKTANEGLAEAKLVIKTIRNYSLDYPVFFDPEGYDIKGTRNYGVSKSVRTNIALKFLAYIENNGYEAAMYSSKSHFTNNAYWLTSSLDSAYDIWVAQYPGGLNTLASGKTAQTTYNGVYRIWQFSSTGNVNGINGNVDLNVEYEDDIEDIGIRRQTLPQTMKSGNTFDMQGVISSGLVLKNVDARVYTADGKIMLSKSVDPAAQTYDLSQLQSDMDFSTLQPGAYIYRVTASNASKSKTMLKRRFVILSRKRTIEDGIYNICSVINSDYAVAGHTGNQNGGNVRLKAVNSKDNYTKFDIRYTSGGYYKIKCVGSGKYLRVYNNGSASGTNVIQGTGYTYWQIIPSADGYVLVPKCGWQTMLYLSAGKAVNGQNIKIFGTNTSASSRFILEKTTAYAKPATISGQNVPGTLKKGASYSIKGKISSTTKLQKVVVGIYTTSGKAKSARTVTPNSKTYDLSKLDSLIKFGSLKAGTYYYRVSVINSYGYTQLINHKFKVR